MVDAILSCICGLASPLHFRTLNLPEAAIERDPCTAFRETKLLTPLAWHETPGRQISHNHFGQKTAGNLGLRFFLAPNSFGISPTLQKRRSP